VWTPRRIALLVFGVVLFMACYVGYARSFLGAIDGLPSLPESCRWIPGKPFLPPPPPRTPRVEEKLKQAFGAECPELSRPIKLELNSRSMVLAAAQFQIEPDGRVSLWPISVAVFGKDKGDGRYVEINTIRGDSAYLKFDRPVSSLTEISGRKVTEAELTGHIEMVNNRRTAAATDDLFVYISRGPLYFNEAKHLIWTHDNVYLKDLNSQPKPMEVRGKGMEMELSTEPTTPPRPGPATAHKPKNDNITGVKKVILQSNVDMCLYIDARSGFPGRQNPDGAKNDKPEAKKAAAEEPEKAQVTIKTPGRFTYDIYKDHDMARFEVPRSDPSQPLRSPQDVTVKRHHPRLNADDQLLCQRLELRLRRKESNKDKEEMVVAPKPKAPANGEAKDDRSLESGLEIETAHATGTEVTLTSDTENLEAHCNELIYDARTLLTILRGDPQMEAIKDGNVIYAKELRIQDQKLPAAPGSKEEKSYQQVTALGPNGRIDMNDKDHPEKKPMHAFWEDKLVSTRDGIFDLLILTGTARFTDEEGGQLLQADTLKVWLDPKTEDKEPASSTPRQEAKSPDSGRKPHHLEATGNVVARAPEMNVHDTSRLMIWFKDVAADGGVLPKLDQLDKEGGSVPGPGSPPVQAPRPAGGSSPIMEKAESNKPGLGPMAPVLDERAPLPGEKPKPAPATGGKGAPGMGLNRGSEKKDGAPPRPVDLSARSVEAWVLRSEDKNTLDKLWTEGSVQVRQDPATPEEKGVDIKGETLQMNCHPDGNFLVVTGDLAQLRMDKIYILGPEVNIDQTTNKAWVTGIGAMQMDSATTFSGGKLDQPVPLTVHWNKSMLFNGTFAEFHGGIQAEQDKARLACQSLQVFFDQPISLKEGSRNDKPAKVKNLVCDRSVRIEEITSDGDKIVKYQKIEATSVSQNTLEPESDDPRAVDPNKNEGNEIRASGPGNVRIMQRGGDPLAPPPDATKPPPPRSAKPGEEGVMKLTYVNFQNSMYANSRTNTAIFWGNVRVLNLPSDNPQMEIVFETMLEKMPKDAMYLSCDQLTVLNRGDKGHSQQEMLARGRCIIQATEYWGNADTITYNENKDQVILDGGENGLAVLYKVIKVGLRPEVIKGKKITYIRSTGQFKIDGGAIIDGH